MIHTVFCAGSGGRVQVAMSDDILVQWRLRRKLEQARGEAAGRFFSPALQRRYTLQQCYPTAGHICSTAPSHPCQTTPPQCTCCGGGRRTGKEGVRDSKEQEVQTSPGSLVAARRDHAHHTPSEMEQGSTELEDRADGHSTDYTPRDHVTEQDKSPAFPAGTTPTFREGETTPTVGEEEGSVAIGEVQERVPPTHGGLALRELTFSEDTQFTMTFNTETELDTSTCNQQHGPPAMSTPTGHRRHSNQQHHKESTPHVLEPLSPCGLEDGMNE